MDIYEIYNSTLEADKPVVDAIMTQLEADLATKISENIFYFVFDLVPFMTEIGTVEQRNRIVDQVLFRTRIAGIMCKPVGVQIVANQWESPVLFTPGFNSVNFDVKQLEVTVRIRKNSEFMKTWL